MEKLYVSVTKDLVLFKKKQNNVFVFDGKAYVIDAKKNINIEQALQQGAEWRSTKDGLLSLILNGRVILVTHRGHGGGHRGGWKKKKQGGQKDRHGYDKEIEKIRSNILTLKKFTEHNRQESENFQKDIGASDAEVREFSDKFKKLLDDSDYAIRCKSSSLTKILNSSFKNQIQVYEETGEKHSGGCKNPSHRRKWSQVMFGHDGTDGNGHYFAGENYEVYGFLAPKDMSIRPKAGQYGDVVVRLKKENFKGRTTYTNGDSLSLVDVAGDIENPNLAGFMSARRSKDGIGYIKSANNVNEYARNFAGSYIELQFHGKNPEIGDIESVTFTSSHSKLSKTTFKKLRKNGIKMYYDSGGAIEEIKTESDLDKINKKSIW